MGRDTPDDPAAGADGTSSPAPEEAALLGRIQREAGVPDLLEALAERLTPTDLQSLLLAVYRRKAAQVTPGRLLERYATGRFFRPAPSDPRELRRVDQLALALLPAGYEPLELSPLCPLGGHSVPATVDQNRIVATSRNSEVVADATNAMALESAWRRRRRGGSGDAGRVRLFASHRVLRAQRFEDPGAHPHFRLLALTAAGRDAGSHRFELEELHGQLDFFLRVLEGVRERGGASTGARVRVTLLDDEGLESRVRESVLAPLAEAHPRAAMDFDPWRRSGRAYYRTLCFKVHCIRGAGEEIEVGDGGFTDWTQRLLSNRKERLLIGCVASEQILRANAPTGI